MKLELNLDRKIGKIKNMNATGQAPWGGGVGYDSFNYFHYLSDVCVPYVRLHDVGGAFASGKFVDIPNIFRNFDADENDPASYDFAFTDAYLEALDKNGIKPYYRLGVTIENHAEIKSYHIDPPKDYDKWARICEHIIAHYNEGWADGFHYGIEYWEIWNEPDDGDRISQMWNGTAEDYYRLYDVTSKHLKSKFPNIKIGGYAATAFYAVTASKEDVEKNPRWNYFLNFFHGFMKYIKEHNSPIDFFSWHSYSFAEGILKQATWVREQLDNYGFSNIESHLNEWNPPTRYGPLFAHAAQIAATLLGSQNHGIDMLMIYDAKLTGGQYSAFFSSTQQRSGILTPTYYAYAAFSSLYKLGTQVELKCDTEKVYAISASNGKKHSIMISNISGSNQPLEIKGADLSDARWYVIDQDRILSWSPELKTISNNSVVLIEF